MRKPEGFQYKQTKNPRNTRFLRFVFFENELEKTSPFPQPHCSKLTFRELWCSTSCFETVLKSSEWRFPLIFQGFSGYSTKIAPPFNHKNGGTLSTHGRGKCGIYNAQKVFGLIILHLRIDVHSCLAVFMPRKILNCLWINASIQKIGNVGMP